MKTHKNSFEKKNYVSFGNIKRHFAHVKQEKVEKEDKNLISI